MPNPSIIDRTIYPVKIHYANPIANRTLAVNKTTILKLIFIYKTSEHITKGFM